MAKEEYNSYMSEDNKRILEKQLWAVANVLRGKMNADEYKNYILGFIFYKYLSEKLELYINEKLLAREEYTFRLNTRSIFIGLVK
jgi:type I restriction enzyme M protein